MFARRRATLPLATQDYQLSFSRHALNAFKTWLLAHETFLFMSACCRKAMVLEEYRSTRPTAIFQLIHVSTATLDYWSRLFDPSRFPEILQLGITQVHSLTWRFRLAPGEFFPHDMPIFPNLLFPNLHTLSCRDMSLASLRSMLHQDLRHLELHTSPRCPIAALLAALAPMLEELLLCLNAYDDAPTTNQGMVVLPDLQRLCLYGGGINPPYWCTHLLRFVIYPGTTTSVPVQFPESRSAETKTMLSLLAAKHTGEGVIGPLPEFRSIAIESSGYQVSVTLWPACRPLDTIAHDQIDYSRLQTMSCDSHRTFTFCTEDDIASTFLSRIPLSSIRAAFVTERDTRTNPLQLKRIAAAMSLF